VFWLVGIIAVLMAGILWMLFELHDQLHQIKKLLALQVRNGIHEDQPDSELVRKLDKIERHTRQIARPHYEQAKRDSENPDFHWDRRDQA
jgi:hypothetical protein